jgi:hypothetical protein
MKTFRLCFLRRNVKKVIVCLRRRNGPELLLILLFEFGKQVLPLVFVKKSEEFSVQVSNKEAEVSSSVMYLFG